MRITTSTDDRNLPYAHSDRAGGVQVTSEVSFDADGIPWAKEIEAHFPSGIRDEAAVLFCLQQAEEYCKENAAISN